MTNFTVDILSALACIKSQALVITMQDAEIRELRKENETMRQIIKGTRTEPDLSETPDIFKDKAE